MDASGLIAEFDSAAKLASPNFNQRALPVSMLVLHYTGMKTAGDALNRLCDPKAKVSAHYVVDESGKVFQLVAEEKRAWHAGLSYWRGITDVNSASIGVEIVNGGHDFDLPSFPAAQISSVKDLCKDIISRHSIFPVNIVGHNEISLSRKLDPGEKFPWQELAEAGIGLWPEKTGLRRKTWTKTEAKKLLSAIGYEVNSVPFSGKDRHCLISEFQRRYRPQQIDGVLDEQTWQLLHGLSVLS